MQHQAQPVFAEVPCRGRRAGFLDEQVHGFGASVADATGDEVGQKFGASGVDRAANRLNLVRPESDTGHRPVVEPAGGLVAIAAAVDGAKLLSGNPGGSDAATLVAGVDDGHQPCPAGVDEVFSATAQHRPYPVERVIGAPAVSVRSVVGRGGGESRRAGRRGGRDALGVLLDSTAHVIDAGEPESHDMEWVEHLYRGGQSGRQGRAVPAEPVQRRYGDPGCPAARLLTEPVGQHFSIPTGLDVNQSSAVQMDDAGG